MNYRQEPVVQSFGLHFFVHYVMFVIGMELLSRWTALNSWIPGEAFRVVLLMLFLTSLGWIDDHYGERETKGFKGHIRALLNEKKVTTGLLKAVLGLLISMAASYYVSPNVWIWTVHTLVIVLSIHVFNLMDVRPGRALKGFWFCSLGLLPLLGLGLLVSVYLPLFLSTLVLFQYDRNRLAMLGDTGSLVLGGVLGYMVVGTAQWELNLLYLFLFGGLSVLAEKISFTMFIKKKPWLSKVDNWGIR